MRNLCRYTMCKRAPSHSASTAWALLSLRLGRRMYFFLMYFFLTPRSDRTAACAGWRHSHTCGGARPIPGVSTPRLDSHPESLAWTGGTDTVGTRGNRVVVVACLSREAVPPPPRSQSSTVVALTISSSDVLQRGSSPACVHRRRCCALFCSLEVVGVPVGSSVVAVSTAPTRLPQTTPHTYNSAPQNDNSDGECVNKAATWLILPVVICLSQRLSHACLSISCVIL